MARFSFLALTFLPSFSFASAQTKPSKYGPVTEGYFHGADGVRLFYRKVGKGKNTVVFLHGGPGLGINDGGYDMEPLARGRVLLMYDQRGSGRSDIVTDSKLLTADYQVRDLEAFRQHFKLERINVPAVVVEGEKSNVPLDATRVWAASLPNARLLLIPNAGHLHFIEQPAAFFSAADRFLRGK